MLFNNQLDNENWVYMNIGMELSLSCKEKLNHELCGKWMKLDKIVSNEVTLSKKALIYLFKNFHLFYFPVSFPSLPLFCSLS